MPPSGCGFAMHPKRQDIADASIQTIRGIQVESSKLSSLQARG